jgi:hypothetical protein
MVRRCIAIAVLAAAAGCGDFETPSIVLDLRVLGATVTPPEIVADVDPDNPEQVELEDVEVCALVADPNESRRLAWSLVACAPTDDKRCNEEGRPFVNIGTGTVDDPEESPTPVSICDTLPASAQLLAVIQDALENDNFSGLGGIPVQIELAVWPAGADFASTAQFAAKTMLYSPRIPEQRVANQNPSVAEITATTADDSVLTLPVGRCNEVTAPVVAPGETLRIEPIEPDGVREDYVVPTLDGSFRTFTESLRYAFYATAGEWSPENSGGPKDPFGNEPNLWADWTAPQGETVGAGLDVRMWLVQRDERGGLAWYESCVRVEP